MLVCTDSTSVVSYINHQGGLHSCPLYKLAHQILVWSQDKLLLLRAVHIPGHLNVGADILSRQGQRPKKWILHPEVVKQIWSFWPGSSGPLCYSGDIAMSPVVLSDSPSSPWTGRYGSDLAESSSVLCTLFPRSFCSREIALGDSGESALGRGQPTVGSTVLAGASMVLGPNFSPRRLSMGDSRQEGSPLTGGNLSPPPGAVEAVGVAPERAQLIAFSLSTEVTETILQSRAPSMRKLYALKWRLFTSWCGDHQLDPVNCPIGTVLEFLQANLSAGLTHSTIKVYVAAIAAHHAPLGGQSVGRHPLVTRFLHEGAESEAPSTVPCPHVELGCGVRGFLQGSFRAHQGDL